MRPSILTVTKGPLDLHVYAPITATRRKIHVESSGLPLKILTRGMEEKIIGLPYRKSAWLLLRIALKRLEYMCTKGFLLQLFPMSTYHGYMIADERGNLLFMISRLTAITYWYNHSLAEDGCVVNHAKTCAFDASVRNLVYIITLKTAHIIGIT